MNSIRLFFKSAKGSVFSSLTLFVVLGAVLLTLNYTLSQYLYIRRAGEMFENAGLSGGLHFVNTTPYDAEGQEALDARIESLRESGEMEKLITRRSAGVTIGGTEYQLVLYDVDVYPAIYGAPHKGSWPEGGEPLGGVVAGVNPSSVPVGETVMVRSSIPGNDASLEVQITGTLAYPPMTFQTGYYISNISMMTADNFFGEERLLYVPYSEALAATVTASFNLGSAQPVSSGILLFAEDTAAERREEIRKELSVYAQVTPVDTILQSTRAHVSESMRRLLPAPLFLLAVTSLAYISVAVLGIYRRRADFTIYAMEGCTKRRMLLLAAAQSALPLLFTDALVAAVLLVLKRWAESGKFALPGVLFGWQNFALTAAASVLLLTVVIGIAAFTTGRLSPTEELRRAKE